MTFLGRGVKGFVTTIAIVVNCMTMGEGDTNIAKNCVTSFLDDSNFFCVFASITRSQKIAEYSKNRLFCSLTVMKF